MTGCDRNVVVLSHAARCLCHCDRGLTPRGVRAASKGAGHDRGYYVRGEDAHKKNLFLATSAGARPTPVTWQIANEPQAVRRLVRKLEREAPGPVRVCYEAGVCGYALQRQLTTTRVTCQVIAPALIARKPGERIKTNRRDRANWPSCRAQGC